MAHKALGRGLEALLSNSKKQVKDQYEKVTLAKHDVISTGANEIPISDIEPNRHQPRTYFDENALSELAASIKKHGVQQPLVVTALAKPGKFELVMGERRLRASKIAGLLKVPCIVKELSNRERFELALVENIQREDLNAMEEAVALDGLMKEYGLTQEDVASTLGVSRSSVANVLRFLRLHENVQDAIRSNQISEGHAKVLAGVTEHSEQLRFLKRIVDDKLSVRGLEALISHVKPESKPRGKTKKQTSPEVKTYEEELQRVLGRRVEIQTTGKKGWVKFAFYSPWDLDNLCQKFGINKPNDEA